VSLFFNSPEGYIRTDLPVGDTFSVSLWFRPNNSGGAVKIIWSMNDGVGLELDAIIADLDDELGLYRTDDGDSSQAFVFSGNSYVQDVWNHVVASSDGNSSRSIVLNGGTPQSDTENYPQPSGIANEEIALFIGSASGFDGSLAEIAIWDVALSTTEAAQLNNGTSPLKVRPQSLVSFRPFVRDTRDLIRGNTMTAEGTPEQQVDFHPAVQYPSAQILQFPPSGAPVHTATGAPSVFLPTSDGTAEVEGLSNANGAPSVFLPTSAGAAVLERSATGAPSIILPTSAGVATLVAVVRLGSELIDLGTPSSGNNDESITVPAGTEFIGLGYIAWWDGPSPDPSGEAVITLDPTGLDEDFTYSFTQMSPDDNGTELYWLRTTNEGAQTLRFNWDAGQLPDQESVQFQVLYLANVKVSGDPIGDTGGDSTTSDNADLSDIAINTTKDIVHAVCYEWSESSSSSDAFWDEATGDMTPDGENQAVEDDQQWIWAAYSQVENASVEIDDIDSAALAFQVILFGVAAADETATGAPSVFLPTSSGAAEVENTATGAPSVFLPTTSGAAEVINTAAGAPSTILITSAGAAVGEAVHTSDGAPSVFLPTTAGAAEVINTAAGAPTTTLITSAGAALIENVAAGAPVIGLITSAGAALIEKTSTGAVSIIPITSAGAALIESTATGSPIVFLPTSAGEALRTAVKITSAGVADSWDDEDTDIPIVGTGFV
jgi:hypothetical protein